MTRTGPPSHSHWRYWTVFDQNSSVFLTPLAIDAACILRNGDFIFYCQQIHTSSSSKPSLETDPIFLRVNCAVILFPALATTRCKFLFISHHVVGWREFNINSPPIMPFGGMLRSTSGLNKLSWRCGVGPDNDPLTTYVSPLRRKYAVSHTKLHSCTLSWAYGSSLPSWL